MLDMNLFRSEILTVLSDGPQEGAIETDSLKP